MNVIHDWGDADAVNILIACAAAAGDARIVAVDDDRPAVPEPGVSVARTC